jgi:hypothetical protein
MIITASSGALEPAAISVEPDISDESLNLSPILSNEGIK